MDPILGMIYLFGGNFAPSGYYTCNGQLLSISQNTALFSILGTTFGGNGTSTFQLPDLRGRAPIGMGQGAGTSDYALGQSGGAETVTLTTNQLPAHSHLLNVNTGGGGTAPGSTTFLAGGLSSGSGPNGEVLNIYTAGVNTANVAINTASIASTGAGAAVTTIPPYLAVTYVIAIQGIFPSRN